MRARRFILLAGIAGGALIGALALGCPAALAAAPTDVGSWGQAWGDDADVAAPAPAPRPRAQVPQAAMPAPMPQAAMPAPMTVPARPMPTGPSAAEIGGWGDAWAEDAAPPAAAPQPRAAVPAVQPMMPAAPVAPARTAAPMAAPVAAPVVQPEAVVQATPVAPPAAAVQPTAPAATAGEAENPVQLTADQITYDRELGIVTARGRVEIIQEGRMLVADQVSYNLKQDLVAASGNVTLAEPRGETMHTDYMELTGDLKEGFANQIRTIMADNSRMTAETARRVGGNRTDLDNATYTACEPCRSNPNRRPLWQAKAERVTHNQDEKVIEYRDLWMDFAGVPVFYTPYLSHPDPSVKRQTGFLTPTAGVSSNIGTNITVPYFWAIKDNQDITFAPRFLFPSSKRAGELGDTDNTLKHLVLAGEHRWRGMEGEERTFASLTADRYDGRLRGHINSAAKFELDDSWRAGFLVQRATDDTYTRIYSYRMNDDQPWLTTRPYVEGFGRRGYTMAEALSYQGLRAEDAPTRSPLVLPHITTSQISVPDSKGGYYTLDADILSYARSSGTGSTRLSNTVGWNRPFRGSMGDITTISASLRGDAYHSEQVSDYGSVNAGRAIPQVAANWRMPFVRPSTTFPQVIEPMAMVAASPVGGNTAKIPNEDSIGFELDDTNVFRPNRLPGFDRVESGVRGAYGMRWQGFPGSGTWVRATLAQGWRAHEDNTFATGSGFEHTLSDYLASVDVSPSPNIALLNRIRLDRRSGEIRRNENTLSLGSPILHADVSYLMYARTEDEEGNAFDRQHFVTWELSSALSRYWTLRGGISYDLSTGGGPRTWQARLIYDDECFSFYTNTSRNYTYDRDYLAGYALTFNVVFKTLANVPFNVF